MLRKGGVAVEQTGIQGLIFWVFVTTERNWFVKGGVAFAGKLGGGMEVVFVTDVAAFPEVLVRICCLITFLLWLDTEDT